MIKDLRTKVSLMLSQHSATSPSSGAGMCSDHRPKTGFRPLQINPVAQIRMIIAENTRLVLHAGSLAPSLKPLSR